MAIIPTGPPGGAPIPAAVPSGSAKGARDASSPVTDPGVTPARADPAAAASEAVTTKAAFNRSILEAQQRISLNAGNEPMALLLRSAIDAINEELAPTLGEKAIERSQASGLDVSPEATAERIVRLTTAMFSRYQEVHPNDALIAHVDDFLGLIGGGIDKGFAEAREILDGLGVLEGDIAANIDRTYALVQEGLASFRQQFAEPGVAGNSEPE